MSHYKLPKGLRRRQLRDGTFRYFMRLSNKSGEVYLRGGLDSVLMQWRKYQIEIHLRNIDIVRITDLLELFEKCEIPLQDPARQSHLTTQVRSLVRFFKEHGDPEFSGSIPPISSYLQWRGMSFIYRACGEARLVIRTFSWARTHTTLRVGECPWASSTIANALRIPALEELGAALVFYSSRRHIIAPGRHACGNKAHIDTRTPICPVAEAVRNRDALTLGELRDHAVKQLKLDGRPDLAAALSRLTEDELRTALTFAEKKAVTAGIPQMTLGTQRTARLAALRLTEGGNTKCRKK